MVIDLDIIESIHKNWPSELALYKSNSNAMLNLINQWLKARIKSPDGVFEKPSSGSPQGGIISPVLANIYLHYALDLWFEKKVKPAMRGRCMMIRYADDFVVHFSLQTMQSASIKYYRNG